MVDNVNDAVQWRLALNISTRAALVTIAFPLKKQEELIKSFPPLEQYPAAKKLKVPKIV